MSASRAIVCIQGPREEGDKPHRECDFPVTELELEDMKRNVRALTIIGHSISFFRRALTDENSKIPDQTDRIQEHELCLIMLHAINRRS